MRYESSILGGLLLLLVGCSGGNGGTPPVPVAVDSVTITPSEVTLTRGNSVQLAATLKDANGNVLVGRATTWTSADPAKATVSGNGLVQAVGAGPLVISATAGGKTGTAAIMVVDPAAPVSRVELNTLSADLEEGDELKLEATALDSLNNVITGRAVRWTSAEPGVASVSPGGLVTGLRAGVVAVTAKVDGAETSATVRVFAEYPFGLIFDKADIAAPAELHTLDLRDPAGMPMPVFSPGQRASHAAPSPDGSRIAFVVFGWEPTNWQSMIFVANRDGSDAVRLTFLPARNDQPVWSPDGTRIAFRSRPLNEGADIWIVNVDGSGLQNLTVDQPNASQSAPTWSPPLAGNEHRIAYSLSTAGTGLIWTMRDDGTDKRQVTFDDRFFDDEPAWSPDGGTLVFQRSGAGVFGKLHLVASTGGPGRALMPANPLAFGQFSPTWSPDGRLIAFASKHADGETYQIWTVWADGTRLAQRTFERQQHTDPAWIMLH